MNVKQMWERDSSRRCVILQRNRRGKNIFHLREHSSLSDPSVIILLSYTDPCHWEESVMNFIFFSLVHIHTTNTQPGGKYLSLKRCRSGQEDVPETGYSCEERRVWNPCDVMCTHSLSFPALFFPSESHTQHRHHHPHHILVPENPCLLSSSWSFSLLIFEIQFEKGLPFMTVSLFSPGFKILLRLSFLMPVDLHSLCLSNERSSHVMMTTIPTQEESTMTMMMTALSHDYDSLSFS